MAPYPTAPEIRTIFGPLSQAGSQLTFFDNVVDDVDWTILGHSPMSGHYASVSDFQAKTLEVLGSKVLKEPLRIKVIHVTGGGESEWACVEMQAVDAECRNGLKYDMVYNWVIRFNEERKIAQVRAYIDTELLTRAIEQNH